AQEGPTRSFRRRQKNFSLPVALPPGFGGNLLPISRRARSNLASWHVPCRKKRRVHGTAHEETAMIRLAVLFLVIALVAALFGFDFFVNLSFEAARIVFFVFLVLAVLFFVGGYTRGAPPRDLV